MGVFDGTGTSPCGLHDVQEPGLGGGGEVGGGGGCMGGQTLRTALHTIGGNTSPNSFCESHTLELES